MRATFQQEWVQDDFPVFRENFDIDFLVLFYLVCLVISVLWVLLQVVVAVLLDNFSRGDATKLPGAPTRLHLTHANAYVCMHTETRAHAHTRTKAYTQHEGAPFKIHTCAHMHARQHTQIRACIRTRTHKCEEPDIL